MLKCANGLVLAATLCNLYEQYLCVNCCITLSVLYPRTGFSDAWTACYPCGYCGQRRLIWTRNSL